MMTMQRQLMFISLTEYINEAGSIVNPDGGELADYAKMYETLDNIIQKLANKLKESKYKN